MEEKNLKTKMEALPFLPSQKEKQDFQKACAKKGVSMNGTLRKYIKMFAKKNL